MTIYPTGHIANPKRWALLTGAGFSANWGTPTIATLWGELLRHPRVQERPRLIAALLGPGGFDFETILARTQDGNDDFDEADRSGMNEAVLSAYERMDRTIEGTIGQVMNHSRTAVKFLDLFWGDDYHQDTPGFVFTLNQDVLVERMVQHVTNGTTYGRPHVPPYQVRPVYTEQYGSTYGVSVGPDIAEGVAVDAIAETPRSGWSTISVGRHYVKLHSSWDWRNRDRSRDMILGGNKEGQIDARPLLTYYMGLLQDFVSAGNRRLCVIGYSFRDQHINRVLIDGITGYGLKLHVWDVSPPWSLRETIERHDQVLAESKESGMPLAPIWNSLCGYTQGTLASVLDSPVKFTDWCLQTIV